MVCEIQALVTVSLSFTTLWKMSFKDDNGSANCLLSTLKLKALFADVHNYILHVNKITMTMVLKLL